MSNATILYGHIESLEDRVHHFCMLRDEQDRAIAEGHAGRFQTVIPLPFIPDDSELQHLPGPTGLEDLRMLAVSRLMLDNFPHVKAFWIMQTLELSQTQPALRRGRHRRHRGVVRHHQSRRQRHTSGSDGDRPAARDRRGRLRHRSNATRCTVGSSVKAASGRWTDA